nr:hypothetical protein [Chroococcidiopsis cubana]
MTAQRFICQGSKGRELRKLRRQGIPGGQGSNSQLPITHYQPPLQNWRSCPLPNRW